MSQPYRFVQDPSDDRDSTSKVANTVILQRLGSTKIVFIRADCIERVF